MLFKEAILKYKGWKSFEIKAYTMKGIEYDLRNFCLYLRNPELEKITWGDILEYLKGMESLGWDSNSFVGKINSIKKFFQYWHKENPNVLDPNSIPRVHREVKQPKIIDEENYNKILAVIPKGNDASHIRNLVYINLLWDTGARRTELLTLNIQDLDLENKKVLIRTEKARRRRPFRDLFWTNETNEHLKDWLAVRDKWQARGRVKDPEALFIATKGAHTGQRIGPDAPNAFLKEYCLKAKIDIWNPHSFRHHMGRDIIEKGGDISDVASILGHSSVATSYIYTMLNDHALEKRYRKFKGD